MSKRLQVLLEESEMKAIQRAARGEGETVAEWVRRSIRASLRRSPSDDVERRLAVVREAVKHRFPTGEIQTMLAEIERGYGADDSK